MRHFRHSIYISLLYVAVSLICAFAKAQVTVPKEYADLLLVKGQDPMKKIRENLFVRVEVNKLKCYEGESIQVVYKLYTRLRSESRVQKRPSFQGFSVYEMIPPETEEPEKESFRGKEYNVYVLRRVQLIPLQTGTLILDPIEISNEIHFINAANVDLSSSYAAEQIRILMNSAEAEQLIKVPYDIASVPVKVEVVPVPDSEKTFSGAVGKFQLNTYLSEDTVAVNEPLQMTMVVKGKGNLPLITAPEMELPQSWDLIPQESEEKVNFRFYPMEGSKSFRFTLIPSRAGEYIIPPIRYKTFDPEKEKFEILVSDSLKVNVREAEKSAEKEKPLKQDDNQENLFRWWWILPAIVFTGLLLIILYKRRKIK